MVNKNSKKLIVCEGPDDVGLFTRFIKEYLKYPKDSFQINPMGGKSYLLDAKHNKYQTITAQLATGLFDRLLFVVDADYPENDAESGGYHNTEKKIKALISELKLDASNTDYFISCNPDNGCGNLEHLLLYAASPNKRSCIESFIDCIKGMETAGNKKIVCSAYNVIFKEHPYNFDHAVFDPLKQKIAWLFA